MIYRGNAVCRGIVFGKVFIYKKEQIIIEHRNVDQCIVGKEILRFNSAVIKAREDIEKIVSLLDRDNANEAKIFKSYADIMCDVEIIKLIHSRIKEKSIIAEWATEQVYDEFISMFTASSNELTKSKAVDMKDVRRRLILALRGETVTGLSKFSEPVIIVANDLMPSDTATIDKERVLAIITETGGETSHTAILAKSFDIPALLGVAGISEILKDGEEVIVDAVEGCLISCPTDEERWYYLEEERKFREKKLFEQRFLEVDAVSADGIKIHVEANIGSCSEAELKAASYVDGVGLLRTEFLYMQKNQLPGENDQYNAYCNILGAYKGKPVILRTLDIGGDKKLSGLRLTEEPNPFLGCRAIRLCFAKPEIFRVQIRAALRASVFGDLWVMFPMVCSMEDIRKARAIVESTWEELSKEGIKVADNIKIGIMIEIPAIALIADQAVKEVDFASIGTNDLCQYLLAVDRMNPQVMEYYQSCHPAMLRIIGNVADVFRKHGKPLGVCGEMASQPLQASLLLGLGINSLSVNIAGIAAIKSLICRSRLEELKRIADHCCGLSSAAEVYDYCKEHLI